MDLPAVQVRVINTVTDIEELIAELTSPYCTLEALRVEKGDRVKAFGVEKGDRVKAVQIRKRFASALGASKTLRSLDVAFCSQMLRVDDLCTLLQSNEVLKSLTVSTQFAKSSSLRTMLQRNSTLTRLGIVHLDGERWDVTELASVLGSQRFLEQLSIEFHNVVDLLIILQMLAENTNLKCLELTWNQNIYFDDIGSFQAVENAFSAAFSRNERSGRQANETLTRLVLYPDLVYLLAPTFRSNRTIRELVLTEEKPRDKLVAASRPDTVPRMMLRTKSIERPAAPPDFIAILLQALQENNTLRLLDLSGCSAVEERQDIYDAILNCLETKPWLHLNLQDTPLSKSESRFNTIQQKLQQNAKFQEAFAIWNPQSVNSTGAREAFGNWNPQFVNSTGARVFLCGSPRAGKCRSHLP